MAVQILSNLNYPIGNIINQELQNADSARIAVAFLKYSGVIATGILRNIKQGLSFIQKSIYFLRAVKQRVLLAVQI